MAACTLTANRGTFDAFLAYRKVAAQQHTGDYLMRASAVLWRKKTGSTKSYGGIITQESSGTLIRLTEEAPPEKKMHPAWWVAAPVVLPFAIAGGVFYGPYKLAQHLSSKGAEAELVRYNECKTILTTDISYGLQLGSGVIRRQSIRPRSGH
jgi:hypothetical protein